MDIQRIVLLLLLFLSPCGWADIDPLRAKPRPQRPTPLVSCVTILKSQAPSPEAMQMLGYFAKFGPLIDALRAAGFGAEDLDSPQSPRPLITDYLSAPNQDGFRQALSPIEQLFTNGTLGYSQHHNLWHNYLPAFVSGWAYQRAITLLCEGLASDTEDPLLASLLLYLALTDTYQHHTAVPERRIPAHFGYAYLSVLPSLEGFHELVEQKLPTASICQVEEDWLYLCHLGLRSLRNQLTSPSQPLDYLLHEHLSAQGQKKTHSSFERLTPNSSFPNEVQLRWTLPEFLGAPAVTTVVEIEEVRKPTPNTPFLWLNIESIGNLASRADHRNVFRTLFQKDLLYVVSIGNRRVGAAIEIPTALKSRLTAHTGAFLNAYDSFLQGSGSP